MYHLALAVPPEDDHLEDKLDAAASLPDAEGSVRVTVVHVHDGDAAVEEVPGVARALDALRTAGVEATALGVEADPTEGLLSAVDDLAADAVCIGGRHRSPAGKLQLTPGAQRVLLRAEVPVVVAGDPGSREPRV